LRTIGTLASGGTLETSSGALIEPDSAPAADLSSGNGASVVSMFQTGSIAMKITCWINWWPVAGQSHSASLVGAEW
jgi:hypothetical protein